MLSRSSLSGSAIDGSTFSSGRVRGKSGRCSMAIDGLPVGSGTRVGNTLASLLSTPSNEMSLYGCILARPIRSQVRRSSDRAMAMRGPRGEKAV